MGKFCDIASPAKDFLNDDYTTKITTKIKTKAGCVGVTSETERKVSSGKTSLLNKLSLKWAGPSGFSIDKLKFNADGSHNLETSLTGVAPGLKFTFAGSDSQTGNLGVEWGKGAATVTGSMDIINLSEIEGSACFSKDAFSFGGAATYGLASGGNLSSFGVGASFTKNNLFASVTTASKCSQANLGLTYKVSPTLKIGSSSSHSASSPLGGLTFGVVHDAGSKVGILKAKVNSDGNVNACLVKTLDGKVTLTPSVEVNAKNLGAMRFGCGVQIG